MAVKIRLKRMGSKKKPFYRIISTDSRNARDGRFIETLGYYNPLTDPAQIKVDEDDVFKWLERGAVPTTSAASLLKQVGVMQKWQFMKQGVKKEDLDAKLEAMGVKTAPQAGPKKLKKAAKEKAAAATAKEAEAKEADAAKAKEAEAAKAKEAEAAKVKEAEAAKAKEAEAAAAETEPAEAAAEPAPEEAPKEEVKAEAAPEAAAEPAPEADKKEGDAS